MKTTFILITLFIAVHSFAKENIICIVKDKNSIELGRAILDLDSYRKNDDRLKIKDKIFNLSKSKDYLNISLVNTKKNFATGLSSELTNIRNMPEDGKISLFQNIGESEKIICYNVKDKNTVTEESDLIKKFSPKITQKDLDYERCQIKVEELETKLSHISQTSTIKETDKNMFSAIADAFSSKNIQQ